VVLVGRIAGRIGNIAPEVTLDFRPSGTLNILDLLDRGELDLAIGPFAEHGERFSSIFPRAQMLMDRTRHQSDDAKSAWPYHLRASYSIQEFSTDM
jgi:DNA-binding transcriptional LysR family regulator